MSDERIFKGWINPLQFLQVDEPWASMLNETLTLEAVLGFLCTPGVTTDLDSLVARYREISVEKARLFAAPAEERILEKLIWPLRNAKASYMVGNYLGTISLCGMVTEMVTVLLFEISELSLNNEPLTDKEQEALFGSSFEKLGQDRRVKVLRAFDIINQEMEPAFNQVRLIRRKYLHYLSQDHGALPKDAVDVYTATLSLIVQVIGQDTKDGRIYLNPSLVKHLDKRGIYEPENEK